MPIQKFCQTRRGQKEELEGRESENGDVGRMQGGKMGIYVGHVIVPHDFAICRERKLRTSLQCPGLVRTQGEGDSSVQV